VKQSRVTEREVRVLGLYTAKQADKPPTYADTVVHVYPLYSSSTE
jgi:hypothetical protein